MSDKKQPANLCEQLVAEFKPSDLEYYETLAYFGEDAKPHPTLGLLVAPDGMVLRPKRGLHPTRWTYGWKTAQGYRMVEICGKYYYVHRLVAETFIGPAPEGKPQIDHIDRNRTNNCVSNLRWVSAAENALNKATQVRDLIAADPTTYCNTPYRRRVGVKLGAIEDRSRFGPDGKKLRGRPSQDYDRILRSAVRAPDGYLVVPRRFRHNAIFRRYLREHSIEKVHYTAKG